MALISNNSLTPTRLDPKTVFTPFNYPDNRSVIGAFRRAVQMCLEDPEERTGLFTALKKFQASMVVEELMDDLNGLLDHPDKRILYKYISPLVPSRLRGEYKSLVPHIPSFEKKVVRLKQQGNHPYGFSVRGGKEFGCGIFVTNVLKSSKSAQAGLMPGDQIIRVNGLIISESTHNEFVNLIKWKHSLTLTIKVVGLIPELKPGWSKVTWKSVGETRGWQSSTRIGVHGPIQSTKRIQVILKGNESLGASIKTSSVVDAGVLIVHVVPNSPADNAGLRCGNEIVEVNGKNLIGKTLDEASRILRSSDSLVMTIRVEEQSSKRYMYGRNGLDSVSASDFEIGPHNFDVDAEMLRHGRDEETGFVLRTRADPPKTRNNFKKTPFGARIPVIDAEVEQSRLPPTLASPAAFGHGPALAMPTILGMPLQGNSNIMEESTDFGNFHHSLGGEPTSPKRSSIEIEPLSPVSPPTPIPLIGRATVEGCEDGRQSPKVVRDLSSQFQFPVDEDESGQQQSKKLSGQSSGSVLKKEGRNGGPKLTKKPTFSDNIQIIPQKAGSVSSRTSHDSLTTTSVHPSNLSFSPEILQGRQVQFHTIPKDGPLRLAIRGGIDTPLGPQIIISRIIEGGTAARYGKLNIGDQVLVCDGVSLIDVTHDEAGQAFKRAMDLESSSIDLVVAVNPEANTLAGTQHRGMDTNI